MQDAVDSRQQGLAQAIGRALPDLSTQRLRWVSPVQRDDYREFHDGAFLDAVGLGSHRSALRRFWPAGGPRWDALATTSQEGVVLVEAKAHLGETPRLDRCRASSRVSRTLIERSFQQAREDLAVPAQVTPWTDDNYQTANRLAFLWWLSVERSVPAWLVFLGFTDSPDWTDPLSPGSWSETMSAAFKSLGLPDGHGLSDRVCVVSMPAVGVAMP
jgi:hypothetical protein